MIDWPEVLDQIADTIAANAGEPCTQERLAQAVQVPRGTLRGWLAGTEPRHSDGERVICRWMAHTGRMRFELPLAGNRRESGSTISQATGSGNHMEAASACESTT